MGYQGIQRQGVQALSSFPPLMDKEAVDPALQDLLLKSRKWQNDACFLCFSLCLQTCSVNMHMLMSASAVLCL